MKIKIKNFGSMKNELSFLDINKQIDLLNKQNGVIKFNLVKKKKNNYKKNFFTQSSSSLRK